MLQEYFSMNYGALSVLLVLWAFMFYNRKQRIPLVNMFKPMFILILVLTFTDYANEKLSWTTHYDIALAAMENPGSQIRLHTVISVISYSLRPIVILLQLLILVPNKKLRLLCMMPAAVNAAVYSTALFGSHAAFSFPDNHFAPGPLRFTIYLVSLFYVVLGIVFAIIYFRNKDKNRGILMIVILTLSVTDAVYEAFGPQFSITTEITAICALTYFVFLTNIYQQELFENNSSKEREIAEKQMLILRDQIQPHFIYNCLNMIRTLTRKDSRAAVDMIDYFSEYLQAHFRVLKEERLVTFEQELENVKVFLRLAMADYAENLTVEYDLQEKQFNLPLLCLEPIVENAVKYGFSSEESVVRISSSADDTLYYITVTNSRNANDAGMTRQESDRISVGISNVRQRLKSLCGGTLEITFEEKHTKACIAIPKEVQK